MKGKRKRAAVKEELTWLTADKREIEIPDLGDVHLINILRLIESNLRLHGSLPPSSSLLLPQGHINLYPALFVEALSRGLFNWDTDRKYVTQTIDRIAAAFEAHAPPRDRIDVYE